MKKNSRNHPPFTVPEGYFEGFPGRLKERIHRGEQRKVPVRKLGRHRVLRIAIAAALTGLALLSIPLSRVLTPGTEQLDAGMAYLEELGIYHNDYELATYLGGNDPDGSESDEKEALVSEAIEYLAMSNVELDILFE